MKSIKHTECSLYYIHHMSSKVGAIVTTIMLSALLILFIVGRSTLDYSSLHIPEKEEIVHVMSIKIHTLTEEQINAVVHDAPVQKKRVVKKNTEIKQEQKQNVSKHVATSQPVETPLAQSTQELVDTQGSDNGVEEVAPPVQESATQSHVEKNDATEIEKAIASILQAIEKKKTYPRVARRAGYEGVVQIRVTINKDGIITQYALHTTSGYNLLDNATLETIKKLHGTKVTNAVLNTSMEAIIPIRYSLKS